MSMPVPEPGCFKLYPARDEGSEVRGFEGQIQIQTRTSTRLGGYLSGGPGHIGLGFILLLRLRGGRIREEGTSAIKMPWRRQEME